jgi:hypothetical protein
VGTLRIGPASAPLYLLVECSPNEAASGDVVDDFHFGPTAGADDLSTVRANYATSGRNIGEEQF